MNAPVPPPDAPFGEARNKVTGGAVYTFDFTLPYMLHGKLLRSPLPHARIRGIDTSAAEAMPGVVWIPWYATVLRQEPFAAEVSRVAPLSLRYGATQYAVHRSRDDRYRITQMVWFEDKADWYRYWDGPEMIEFRARNSGH